MDDSVLHVFLTRFNVMSGGKEQQIRQRESWLAERFDLFETFCWPSMAGQARKDFKWLVFFDAATPETFKAKIHDSYRLEQFQPVYVTEWSSEVVAAAIREHISPGHQRLLTSRLDNDDGLHHGFVAALREGLSSGEGFYNFPRGLIYRAETLYEYNDPANAFASYLEPIQNFKTVWHVQHQTIMHQPAVFQMPLSNAWLQVVHGANVSNRVRGRRLASAAWPDGYPHLMGQELRSESNVGLMLERLLFFPLRSLRDLAARGVKPLRQRVRRLRRKV